MSQRREKKIRRQMRRKECWKCLEDADLIKAWADSEPPIWRIFAWRRWMRNRPRRKL